MSLINVNGEMNVAVLIVPHAWGVELLDKDSVIGQFAHNFGIFNNGLDLLYDKYILTNKKTVMKFLLRETKKVTFHTIKYNQPSKTDSREIRLARVWAKFLFREKDIEKLDRKRCYFRAYTLAHYRDIKGKVAPLGPLKDDNTYQSLNRIEFDQRWEVIENRLQKYISCISFGLPYEWNFDNTNTDDTLLKCVVQKKKKNVYLCNQCKLKRKISEENTSDHEDHVNTFIKRQCENISDSLLFLNYEPSNITSDNDAFVSNISYPYKLYQTPQEDNCVFKNTSNFSETNNFANQIPSKDHVVCENVLKNDEIINSESLEKLLCDVVKVVRENEISTEYNDDAFNSQSEKNVLSDENKIFPLNKTMEENKSYDNDVIQTFSFGDELKDNSLFHEDFYTCESDCKDLYGNINSSFSEFVEDTFNNCEEKSLMGLQELNDFIKVDDNFKTTYENVFKN